MKKTKKYLLLAIMLVMLILFGIQRNVYKQQYKINSYSLAIFVDGEKKDTYPERGNYNVSVDCMGKANGSWDYNNWGPMISNVTDNTVCDISFKSGKKFNEYIMDAAKTDSNIVYIEQPDTVQTSSNAKEEYRYIGVNPNNYVYFGCDSNCTEDNLYRIIGVIPTQIDSSNGRYKMNVKLIKNDYYTETESGFLITVNGESGYLYNNVGSNAWENSTLQLNVLNGVFWKNLGDYQKYVQKVKWYLGSPTSSVFDNLYKDYSANNFYQMERSNTKSGSGGVLSYFTNIGLMYPSDYAFTIEKNYWETSVYTIVKKYQKNSWLFNKKRAYAELTISPESSAFEVSSKTILSWYINNINGSVNLTTNYAVGSIFHHWVAVRDVFEYGVRPVFYLNEKVEYTGGNGTQFNPYRITVGEE